MENTVRTQREKKRMTQQKLAERAGIGQATVSDIETGRYIPGVDIALLIAHALGCSVEDIFKLQEGDIVVQHRNHHGNAQKPY